MTSPETLYSSLESVIQDPLFPRIDSLLRRGKHIDGRWVKEHSYIKQAEHFLVAYYARFHTNLVCAPEDFYYLLPRNSDYIRARKLERSTMILGQVVAKMYIDPEHLAKEGWIEISKVVEQLLLHIPEEKLAGVFERKSVQTDLDKNKVQEGVLTALRQLKQLGMLRLEGERVQPQTAILRFAELAREGEAAVSQVAVLLNDDSPEENLEIEGELEIAEEPEYVLLEDEPHD